MNREQIRRFSIALVATLLIHALFFWLFPWEIESRNVEPTAYELILESPQQKRFIETNPDLPSNEPDETDNFAARSQQASQLKPSKQPFKEAPNILGESDTSQKVVSGDKAERFEDPLTFFLPPSQPNAAEALEQSFAPLLPPKRPDFIRDEEVEDPRGVASQLPAVSESSDEKPLSTVQAVPLNVPKVSEPSKTLREQEAQESLSPQVRPQARPRVAPDVLRGEILKSQGSAPVRGQAVNASFNEFGDYLQRLYEVVGIQWIMLNRSLRLIRDEVSAVVVIEFTLNKEGKVEDLAVRYSTAGQAAELIAKDAIRSRAPFELWSEEMIAELKPKETIVFYFNYGS